MADESQAAVTQNKPRYWLSCGDGVEYGPYAERSLRRFVAEGRITADCMVCAASARADGAGASAPRWMPVNALLGEGFAPALAPGTTPIARRVSLVPSILATVASLLFCCLPVGIPAMVYAMRANMHFESGAEDEGLRSERLGRRWLIAAWVLVAVGAVFTVMSTVAALQALQSILGVASA